MDCFFVSVSLWSRTELMVRNYITTFLWLTALVFFTVTKC
jgi:hypothetical protein